MDKQETPEDSPPAYEVLSVATSNPESPPPVYSPLEPQLFAPLTASQFPLPTGQPTTPYGHVHYAGLPEHPVPPQQQITLVSASQSRPVTVRHVQSFTGHIVFSCVVFWLCNPLFGLTAFILAVVASSSAVANAPRARKLGQVSVGLSITGIIISVIIAVVLILVYFVSICHNSYRYDGSCYNFKTYVGVSGSCEGGVISANGYCYTEYCFHYPYRSSCYKYRVDIGMFGTCSGVKSGYYCYYASCKYSHGSSCYEFKTYVGRSGSCSHGVKSSDGYCYSTSCPYHAYADSCYRYKKYVGSSGRCNGTRSDNYCYFTSCSGYTYRDKCYNYKTYVGPYGSCSNGVKSSTDHCYSTSCHDYPYGGSCYKNRKTVGPSSTCTGARSGSYCYFNDCSGYAYRGICYGYKTFVGIGSSDLCYSGIKSSAGYCYSTSCPFYAYRGTCYKHRTTVGRYDSCSRGVKGSDGYYRYFCYW